MTGSYFDECLADLGAQVRYVLGSKNSKVVGGHTIIVDKTYGFTGSFDMSWNSELREFSHMQVISGLAAHKALTTLRRLRNLNTELIPGVATRIIRTKGNGPCEFKPMTMMPQDLQRIRDLYRKDVCVAKAH